MSANSPNGTALGEALFWYGEKLMWGYEGVEKNPGEAFKLYGQAAALGFTDAAIRVGQLHEHGKGTDFDPQAALRSYAAAVRSGNFFGLAFLAKLLSRTTHLRQAEAAW